MTDYKLTQHTFYQNPTDPNKPWSWEDVASIESGYGMNHEFDFSDITILKDMVLTSINILLPKFIKLIKLKLPKHKGKPITVKIKKTENYMGIELIYNMK